MKRMSVTSDGEEEDGDSSDVDDMINMLNLTEASLLRNVQHRYSRNQIYTYIGDILLAVNPYRLFDIYGPEDIRKYHGVRLSDNPPHLYAIGDAAFMRMCNELENQVIVISGESGSGKTESTKLLMTFLAAMDASSSSSSSSFNPITRKILEANPLLEAFGNAKTVKNDNSSRFGKYVELHFQRQCLVGAKTTQYLLEKSRIVKQDTQERNYHIFYNFLSALENNGIDGHCLHLEPLENYIYLNKGLGSGVPSRNDLNDFKKVIGAMEMLSFTEEEKLTIYKILSAVLKLGNIYFIETENDYMNETVEVGNEDALFSICDMLEIKADGLAEALTSKITETRNERVITPFSSEQALDTRDAVAKSLYHSLFMWLVQKINDLVRCDDLNSNTTSIAILDIFGFENFDRNSLEQLCINFANESLQFYFNRHVFALEQEEYEKEGIPWNNITYLDNANVTEIFNLKPNGIIFILDDESNFPTGTDRTFLNKCVLHHSSNSVFGKSRMSTYDFTINHYSGHVAYDVTNFIDKNRDTLRTDLVHLIIQSKNTIISQMYQDLYDRIITRSMTKTYGTTGSGKSSSSGGSNTMVKLRTPTLVISFNESLQSLIETMSRCRPWFVRCLKPNEVKAPMLFVPDLVQNQLKYTGILETVKIRKLGFPIRFHQRDFADRYFVLLPSRRRRGSTNEKKDKDVCRDILKLLAKELAESFHVGKTKIFLKDPPAVYLDGVRTRILKDSVIILQKYARRYVAVQNFQKIKRAVIVLQSYARVWLARSLYQALLSDELQSARYLHLQQSDFAVNLQAFSWGGRGCKHTLNMKQIQKKLIKKLTENLDC